MDYLEELLDNMPVEIDAATCDHLVNVLRSARAVEPRLKELEQRWEAVRVMLERLQTAIQQCNSMAQAGGGASQAEGNLRIEAEQLLAMCNGLKKRIEEIARR